MGLYAEAVDMMQRSVDLSGMGHPLACRAAGVMTYLYDSGKGAKDRALVRMFQCKVVTFFVILFYFNCYSLWMIRYILMSCICYC
jgi:hypothetical protein